MLLPQAFDQGGRVHLVGNYKADQVHAPALIERLGQ